MIGGNIVQRFIGKRHQGPEKINDFAEGPTGSLRENVLRVVAKEEIACSQDGTGTGAEPPHQPGYY